MIYTSLDYVKSQIQTSRNTDDGQLLMLIEAASRAFDRKCTGVPDAVDYFKLETVVSERLFGQADYLGQVILCYPHKPIITACTAFSYQENITTELFTVLASRVECDGPKIRAYPSSIPTGYPSRVRVVVSYTGGLGAVTADLPDDLQDMVALLAIRYYREAETGLSDSIGVAELSTMVYTKAWPTRVLENMQPYIRRVGWRLVS